MTNTRNLHYGSGKLEVRTAEGGSSVLEGLAVPYGQWSQKLFGYFTEQFEPRAFSEHLAENPDVICCFDHEERKLLGRTSSGTLKLEERANGVYASCTLPNTTYAKDLVEMVNRGDVRGMSFIFDSLDEDWGKRDGEACRSVKKAKLYEVSFVINPAYLQTTVAKRSLTLPQAKPKLLSVRDADRVLALLGK